MIRHEFDHGWGPQWFLKKLEQELIHKFLRPLADSDKKIAVINSTWYNPGYHSQVLSILKTDPVDAIVLVAMIDSAIPYASWFRELEIPVFEVGSYNSDHELDFWAVMVHRYFECPSESSLMQHHAVDYAFMCLNRKPHPHRVRFWQDLKNRDLLDHGLVSMGSEPGHAPMRLLDSFTHGSDLAPNHGSGDFGIVNDIASLGDITNWNRHMLNIVTETAWNIDTNRFVSEKIYKPIMGHRPFLVFDQGGAGQWLSDHGFCDYMCEFQDITDLDLCYPENIAPFLKTLVLEGPKYWKSKLVALNEKIRYNRHAFNHHCKKIYQKINQGIQCQI